MKSGEIDSNGQPNMVAMGRLLRELLNWRIDSYYLLIVKLKVAKEARCQVFFCDILDYLDCVTFDSGPGQIMLKERLFYQTFESEPNRCGKAVTKKVDELMNLLEDGEKRLFKNRQRRLGEFHELHDRFRKSPQHVIDQSSLNLA